MVLSLIAASLVGLVGVPSFDQPLADAERVFIELVGLLFHPLIAGICLAAILAAIMSTADSQLLVASSAFTEDLYRVLWRRQASERELVLVGRLAVVGIAAAAFLLALDPDSQVLDLVAYAWAGFGAAFGPGGGVLALLEPHEPQWGVGWHHRRWCHSGALETAARAVSSISTRSCLVSWSRPLAILLVSRLERPAGVE